QVQRAQPRLEAGIAGEHALAGGHAVPGGGVEHVLARIGGGAGRGGRRGAAELFEPGLAGGALVAAAQLLQRHLPVEPGEAGRVQVRIGTADGAHGTARGPVAAALAAMAGTYRRGACSAIWGRP